MTRTRTFAGSDAHCQEARAAARQRLGASGYQAGQHPAPPQGACLDPHGLWLRSSNRYAYTRGALKRVSVVFQHFHTRAFLNRFLNRCYQLQIRRHRDVTFPAGPMQIDTHSVPLGKGHSMTVHCSASDDRSSTPGQMVTVSEHADGPYQGPLFRHVHRWCQGVMAVQLQDLCC